MIDARGLIGMRVSVEVARDVAHPSGLPQRVTVDAVILAVYDQPSGVFAVVACCDDGAIVTEHVTRLRVDPAALRPKLGRPIYDPPLVRERP